VHLTRRDKVAQAVSYVKAQQTGLWHAAPEGTELERLSLPQEPIYDAGEIRTRFKQMTAHEHGWEHWFTASEIDPFSITYEELSESPVETLRVMLDHLGLEREAADGVEPGIAKLADDINQDWVARFRAEQQSAWWCRNHADRLPLVDLRRREDGRDRPGCQASRYPVTRRLSTGSGRPTPWSRR
jgi:LPS sulfotransferase NodH